MCLFFSDLGLHIDGFIAAVAYTVVVGATKVSLHVYVYKTVDYSSWKTFGFLQSCVMVSKFPAFVADLNVEIP